MSDLLDLDSVDCSQVMEDSSPSVHAHCVVPLASKPRHSAKSLSANVLQLRSLQNRVTFRSELSRDKDSASCLYQMGLAETTTHVKHCRIVPSKMARSRFTIKSPRRRLGPPTDRPARVRAPDHQFIRVPVVRYHWRLAFGLTQDPVGENAQSSDGSQRSVSEDQWKYGEWGIFSLGVNTGPRYDNSFLEKKRRTRRAGTACQRYTTLNLTGISPGILCTA